MNREENRLESFRTWPSNAPVTPPRIARAGFFYTGNDLTVECYSCGIQIVDWNFSDQVMPRHKRISPNCRFVLNPATSDNVPMCSTQTDSANSLQNEQTRLRSFHNWPIPHIVSPHRLAKAGFYYLKQTDKTKCAFCNGIVVSWEVGDDPDSEHRRHFPHCPFVQNVINRRLPHLQNSSQGSSLNNGTVIPVPNLHLVTRDNLMDLGVTSHKPPKNSRYVMLEARLLSFETWPEDLIQTPDVLAAAGFYYEGSGDQVRCFHCDGGLRHWDPHDDPWTEHAKWFPKCGYVLLSKGIDFVRACSSNATTTPTQEHQGSSRASTARPFHHREVTERDIIEQMQTPQAIQALNIGIHFGRIKQAIAQKLEQTGVGFSSVDAIIEAALDIQHEEGSIDQHPETEDLGSVFSNVERLSETRQVMDVDQDEREVNSYPASQPAASTTTAVSPITEELSIPQAEVVVGRVDVDKTVKPSETVVSVGDENAVLAKPANPKPQFSLEEENRQLKEARLCKICMDFEVCIVFLPCGHLATCVTCASNLQNCPVCRSSIKATVRTYLS